MQECSWSTLRRCQRCLNVIRSCTNTKQLSVADRYCKILMLGHQDAKHFKFLHDPIPNKKWYYGDGVMIKSYDCEYYLWGIKHAIIAKNKELTCTERKKEPWIRRFLSYFQPSSF